MHEGIAHDDKYRMVEDEFLATAQNFTVHLHAAEYKKQEKMARARNAETINSISRPVTGEMSESTKRKLDGIARSKTQHDAVQSLLGKKTRSEQDLEDSSDGEELAYFNTTLRGLMDSPRRKEVPLSKLPYTAATRAAAGFQKPASLHKQDLSQAPESPRLKRYIKAGQPPSSTEPSDLDDDLDAPVPVSKFPSLKKRPEPNTSSNSVALPRIDQPRPRPSNEQNSASRKLPPGGDKNPLTDNNVPPQATQATSNDTESRAARRRLIRARLEETKKEDKDEDKKDLNLIPTFL